LFVLQCAYSMKYYSTSLAETEKIAQTFIENLTPHKGATIVGLYGDLGAGKTTFTQAVAKILGITEGVTSPTYVIEKIYRLEHKNFSHLIHIDAYRLESSTELLNLGWHDIILDPKNLILLEWPEKVADILPAHALKIQFTFVNETTREVEI
jgi:tRNA threonylcarbamoyladenosine biosynthesis protein TsaE